MSGGYIKLHRQIRENWIWQDAEYLRAWVDLLFMAEWRDRDLQDGTVERGSLLTSTRELAERWGWSQNRVIRFLHNLERCTMLTQKRFTQRCTSKTLLTIVNYSDFQDAPCETNAQTNAHMNAHANAHNNTKKKRNQEINNNSAHARVRKNSFHNFEQRDTDLDAFIIQEQRKGG